MALKSKEPLVAVSWRIRPEIKTWLSVEASQKHDRPANWLANKILAEAFEKSKQPQGATA